MSSPESFPSFTPDVAPSIPPAPTEQAVTPERESSPEWESFLGSFEHQCEAYMNLLAVSGILYELTDPETPWKPVTLGYRDAKGKERIAPTVQELKESFLKEMESNPEQEALMKEKVKQGFTKITVGLNFMSLADLAPLLKEHLLDQYKAGTLVEEKDNPDDPEETARPFDLNPDDPLYVWDGLLKGEASGDMVSFPNAYQKEGNGGRTMISMIDEYEVSPDTAQILPFSVVLRQEHDVFPTTQEEARKHEQGGREPIENGKTPHEYLKIFRNPEKDMAKNPYRGESGLTTQESVIDVITSLQSGKGLPYVYEKKQSNWDLESYHVSGGRVACVYALRDTRRFDVSRNDPDYSYENRGVVAAVRVRGD